MFPFPGPPINNFHELSMREALRVDLRNGLNMKSLCLPLRESDAPSDHSAELSCPQKNKYIRLNPNVLRILQSVMNSEPSSVPSGYVGGNWGRWNFGGPGPDAPAPPPLAGEIGAVVTMPGCLDQTIHADAAHLFDHVQVTNLQRHAEFYLSQYCSTLMT